MASARILVVISSFLVFSVLVAQAEGSTDATSEVCAPTDSACASSQDPASLLQARLSVHHNEAEEARAEEHGEKNSLEEKTMEIIWRRAKPETELISFHDLVKQHRESVQEQDETAQASLEQGKKDMPNMCPKGLECEFTVGVGGRVSYVSTQTEKDVTRYSLTGAKVPEGHTMDPHSTHPQFFIDASGKVPYAYLYLPDAYFQFCKHNVLLRTVWVSPEEVQEVKDITIATPDDKDDGPGPSLTEAGPGPSKADDPPPSNFIEIVRLKNGKGKVKINEDAEGKEAHLEFETTAAHMAASVQRTSLKPESKDSHLFGLAADTQVTDVTKQEFLDALESGKVHRGVCAKLKDAHVNKPKTDLMQLALVDVGKSLDRSLVAKGTGAISTWGWIGIGAAIIVISLVAPPVAMSMAMAGSLGFGTAAGVAVAGAIGAIVGNIIIACAKDEECGKSAKGLDQTAYNTATMTCGGTAVPQGALCKFPFTHQGKEYHFCTDADWHEPWCMTDDTRWGNCCENKIRSCEGTAGGAFCKFPFAYRSVLYSRCINLPNDGWNQPWCFTEKKGKWGNCNCNTIETCTGTSGGGSYCKFPFHYQGENYDHCTNKGWHRPWCFTQKPGKWGHCDCR